LRIGLDVDVLAKRSENRNFPEFTHQTLDDSDEVQDDKDEPSQPTNQRNPEDKHSYQADDEHDQALLGVFLGKLGILFKEKRNENENPEIGQSGKHFVVINVLFVEVRHSGSGFGASL
jgi:hypothetical protein